MRAENTINNAVARQLDQINDAEGTAGSIITACLPAGAASAQPWRPLARAYGTSGGELGSHLW
jgi:hypothetical protein